MNALTTSLALWYSAGAALLTLVVGTRTLLNYADAVSASVRKW